MKLQNSETKSSDVSDVLQTRTMNCNLRGDTITLLSIHRTIYHLHSCHVMF